MNSEQGRLFVLAGPSGAGKTTLARHIVGSFQSAVFSVSSTTREPRGSEENGVDYLFIGRDEFEKRIDGGYFLEHAMVHGHLYGTSGEWVREQLAGGMSVVLDIDVQGALQVRESFPSAVLIFILPPTRELLESRLRSRKTDDPEEMDRRMRAAIWETGWIGSFDFFIVNGRLEEAKIKVESIYRSEMLRLDHMSFPREAMDLAPDLFRGLEFWNGRKVVVASGPTREYIDEVRFVSNRSSGLMGRCMAMSFRDAGADVVFITGPSCVPPPPGVRVIGVDSAGEMLDALLVEVDGASLLVMAAAVSDFSPSDKVTGKIQRQGGMDISLKATPDILVDLGERVEGLCPVLAFALEFGERGLERAGEKLARKGASAIFYNPGDDPSAGMESSSNRGVLIFDEGDPVEVGTASKRYIAQLLAAEMGRYMIRKNNDPE